MSDSISEYAFSPTNLSEKEFLIDFHLLELF